jgi:hypothetical protein
MIQPHGMRSSLTEVHVGLIVKTVAVNGPIDEVWFLVTLGVH